MYMYACISVLCAVLISCNYCYTMQERIARAHGSQCGFCTPGFVMSMYTLIRNKPNPTEEEIENAFDGRMIDCQ